MDSNEITRDDMFSKNPFVHTIRRSPLRSLQMYIFTFIVLPFRLVGIVVFFLLSLLVGELATRKMDFTRPMSGFRRYVLLPLFIVCSRMMFFSGGFVWVRHRGRRASFTKAPIIVLAPHSSYFDSLVVVSLGMSSVVGKTETALSPIGSFIKMTQPILVNRDDPMSRQISLQEIRDRANSGGYWPQVLIFPEGTCTNRSCLINYKQGAFSVRCPVQPALIRWGYGTMRGFEGKNRNDTMFKDDGRNWIIFESRSACHDEYSMNTRQYYVDLGWARSFLPVYSPTEEEKADPQLYANNVRAVMAKAIGLPTTDLSFDDCRRIRTAVRFKLPMACYITDYGKLTQALFHDHLSEDKALPSRFSHFAKRLLAMASAAREWHSNGCQTLTDEVFEKTFPAIEANPKTLTLLKRVVNTLPKIGRSVGPPDIRALVVHLSFLLFSDSPLISLRLAFQAFDGTFSTVPTNQGDDASCTKEERDYEEFAAWSISPADVATIITYASRLPPNDVAILVDSCCSVGGISEPVQPDVLYRTLKANKAEVVNCYADYKAEMCLLRRHADRPFCETSSASASVSSIYSLEVAGSETFEGRHRRELSNVSGDSILMNEQQEEDNPPSTVRQRAKVANC